ncbi:F-type H+-transporting ATPase subunit epsilon [Ruminococcaceae bacterium KH2T8]|nr:F-type H+-transporting ATPase subunit epsilon [Ruminococcaceae bacterium KH2T8]
MSKYLLRISTPEGTIFKGDVERLIVRGVEGDLAVMAGHIPFSTVVKEGSYSILFENGDLKKGHIGGGLLNVGSEETTLLAGSIEWEEKS